MEFLPGGLHENPAELHRLLQERLDRAAAEKNCERVSLGYGLCGNALVGIKSGRLTLAVPKVQDCIALFLGSDRAYRREFKKCPGTYYVSAGWYREKVQPMRADADNRASPDCGRQADLAERYGQDNAAAIHDFMNSWKQHYQRSVFIDTGVEETSPYAEYARRLAEENGWRYERLLGDLHILQVLLTSARTTQEVLIVPPEHILIYNALSGNLDAAPLHSAAADGTANEPADSPPTPSVTQSDRPYIHRGVGIDAGGTYTDAVLYDFHADRVTATAKQLTTRYDYTVGIRRALEELGTAAVKEAELVALSTTLATNAIVEGDICRAGLILMPAYGRLPEEEEIHQPYAVVSARMDMDGREVSPVVKSEVITAAEKMITAGIETIAVSGFAAIRNPSHELTVKRIIEQETGLPVTCGHELSDQLNYCVRANTAVFNAQLIPKILELLRDLDAVLSDIGVNAPVVIVKGDGTLISTAVARDKPIETFLSGPAASAAGAGYLTRLKNAIIADVGGTTTDIAALRQGTVRINSDGINVGQTNTHIQAVDMRTFGLGGDSRVLYREGNFTIGPQRVAPVSWLAREADLADTFDFMRRQLDLFRDSTEPMLIVFATGHTADCQLSEEEDRVLTLLRERPYTLMELAREIDALHWSMLKLSRLLAVSMVQYAGFTPTDLLHTTGEVTLWDRNAAAAALQIHANLTDRKPEEIVRDLTGEIRRLMLKELAVKVISDTAAGQNWTGNSGAELLLTAAAADISDEFSVRMTLAQPIIGIGAPARFLLPAAAERLGTKLIIPEFAAVANAVGAITSKIVVRLNAEIVPADDDRFIIHGIASPDRYETVADAQKTAQTELRRLALTAAREAGTGSQAVTFTTEDRITPSAYGTDVFVSRRVSAEVQGPPDLVLRPPHT